MSYKPHNYAIRRNDNAWLSTASVLFEDFRPDGVCLFETRESAELAFMGLRHRDAIRCTIVKIDYIIPVVIPPLR